MYSSGPLQQIALSLAARNRLERVCDLFELRWDSQRVHDIPACLAELPAEMRSIALSELILIDAERCKSQGQSRPRAFYQSLFESDSALVESLSESVFLRVADAADLFAARFQLLDKVGSGAMGAVWRAFDHRLKRIVALKVPHSGRLTPRELRRFLREGRAAAQLHHAGIVQVYDAGYEHDQAFIVSEFIEGDDLKSYMKCHEVSVQQAVHLCLAVAEALAHAHQQGIVHRDLKPANILLDPAGHPHIADFGLAKWDDDSHELTLSGQVVGTASYMSPEQAQGDSARVDQRSDVYALGVILYELLAKRPPFAGDLATIVGLIINSDPPALRRHNLSVPRDVETICLKAIEKRPENRYQSCEDFANDLRYFLRGNPILARRRSALEQAARWARKRPAALALGCLCIISASALLSASRLAQEKHQLLGFRNVVVTSKPAGAKVALVPLESATGVPHPERRICAAGKTPVQCEVPAGEYLVIALLSDGRFHEVYRHVPAQEETGTLAGFYPHQFYVQDADDTIHLPIITIPDHETTARMVKIRGRRGFNVGIAGSSLLPSHLQDVRSFYIDPCEFSFGDLKVVARTLPKRFQMSPLADEESISVSYDHAVAYAEAMGKRLPTEFEYEFAATAGGSRSFAWKVEPRETAGQIKQGCRDTLWITTSDGPRPLYDLCSGLAEWTASPYVPYQYSLSNADQASFAELSVVRGMAAGMDGGFLSQLLCHPRRRYGVNRHDVNPAIGFRCVRSAQPLVQYADLP